MTIQDSDDNKYNIKGLKVDTSDDSSSFHSSDNEKFLMVSPSKVPEKNDKLESKDGFRTPLTKSQNREKEIELPNQYSEKATNKLMEGTTIDKNNKSPLILNMPKYYERILNKGKSRFSKVQEQEDKAKILIQDGEKLKNPFEKDSRDVTAPFKVKNNDISKAESNLTNLNLVDDSDMRTRKEMKMNHPRVFSPIQRNVSNFTQNLNPMESKIMDSKSKVKLPRILSPVERNKTENKKAVHFKCGYSRKKLILRRNLKTDD